MQIYTIAQIFSFLYLFGVPDVPIICHALFIILLGDMFVITLNC